VFFLCSVMSVHPVPSKNCLEKLTILGAAVFCEDFITEHKPVVPHSACAEQSFRNRSTGQYIHFLPNIMPDNFGLKIIY
jgi:hypothetical protein